MTQSELKQVLSYNPDTGLFKRTSHSKTKQRKDKKVGCVRDGYVRIKVYGKGYSAHRLAFLYMTGSMPDQVDHINHIRSDNRWENLRAVTNSDNQKNASLRKDNRSGQVGVSWVATSWIARINHLGERINLGSFAKFSDAVDARKNAEVLYGFHENHGRNADVNL